LRDVTGNVLPATIGRAVLATLWIGLASIVGVTAARSEDSSTHFKEAQDNLDQDMDRVIACYGAADYGCIVDMMDPDFVGPADGRGKLVEATGNTAKETSKNGSELRPQETQYEQNGAIVPLNDVLFAKLISRVPVSVRGKPGTVVGTRLAISKDNGKSWRFVEASSSTKAALEAKYSGLWEQLAISDGQLVPQ
jgi:hypothetical protein